MELKISVRFARKDDFPFIKELAAQSIHYGVPKVRDISGDDLKKVVTRAYDNMGRMYDELKDILIFVAEDEESGERLGYLTLIVNEVEGSTGERQSFIQDLAVKKEHWGKFVVHRLMGRAEEETKFRGLHYICGSISVDNRRAFGTATKGLGYSLERYQIVKKL